MTPLQRSYGIVEALRKYLVKELGREPTERELADLLPVFLCRGHDES